MAPRDAIAGPRGTRTPSSSSGTTAGIPGGYGVICSAATRPAARSAGTIRSAQRTHHGAG